ncbi:MAG: DUF4173 domain-containing protein [bacterium]
MKKTLCAALTGLVVGLFFNLCFYIHVGGLGTTVFFLISLLSFGVLLLATKPKITKSLAMLLLIPIVLLSLSFFIFDAQLLKMFSFLMLPPLFLACTFLLLQPQLPNEVFGWVALVFRGLLACCKQGLKIISAPFTAQSARSKSVIARVSLGSCLAVPLLFVFALLFSSAEPAFGSLVSSFFSFLTEDIWVILFRICLVIGVTVSVGGYFAALLKENFSTYFERTEGKPWQLDYIIASVVLTLVNMLFLLFIGIQFFYMFGGKINITTDRFTYAEYTHKGFIELVVIGLLSLMVILFTVPFVQGKTASRGALAVKGILMLLCVNTLAVVFSAHSRLLLYEEAYGWTKLRFFVHGFIIGIATLYILVLLALATNQRMRFVIRGGIILFFTIYCGTVYWNADAYVANKNFDRFKTTQKIDVAYFKNLSLDALPVMVKRKDELDEVNQKNLEYVIGDKAISKRNWPAWQDLTFAHFQ